MTMFLIMSGAYVGTEFEAEFGRLPPAFLPVGNRRLFEWQLASIRPAGASRTLLSIPEDFVPDEFDLTRLEEFGVELVRSPPGLRLGEAVIFTLNSTAPADGEIRILHGDTLIEDIDFQRLDVLSVGSSEDYYQWADLAEVNKEQPDWADDIPGNSTGNQQISGYFSFSSSHLLIRSITRARGSFIAGLAEYSRTRRLTALQTGSWLDFGHVHTYYRSRTRITTQRAFNDLRIEGGVVAKSSHDARKMQAEADWYSGLPSRLRMFTPQLLGRLSEDPEAGTRTGYEIEYLHYLPLSDLYVFGRLPQLAWRSIFRALSEWVSACKPYRPADAAMEIEAAGALYREKTIARLKQFGEATGISVTEDWTFNGQPLPGLLTIAETAAAAVRSPEEKDIRVIHGDFCFSNILYDFRTQRPKLIDPRAVNGNGKPSIHGDWRYDLAKLHHSVIGRYDFIIAGRYRLERQGPRQLTFNMPCDASISGIQQEFREMCFGGSTLAETDALPISILLFLSMLPLHADRADRQMALLANALRLYRELVPET